MGKGCTFPHSKASTDMRPRYSMIVLAIAGSMAAQAQLVVNSGLFPTNLVQGVLLGGGVTASNITFNGMPGNQLNEQIGSFDGVASNVGLAAGVIMGTGDVTVAVGPNDQGGASLGGGNFGFGDPDLEVLSGVATNDAAILEFDFIPTGDSLQFRYVMSSEEYDEYVCGTVNDAFGFFLSGPGIAGPFQNGAINIALVPGTNVPVSINTVNNGTVGSTVFPAGDDTNCANLDPNWTANSIYYTSNATGTSVQYDGMTVVLTAFALVQCGVQYHIKLAIADGGDTAFDSGVFLEAGSFTSTGQVVPTLSQGPGINGSTMLEGCGPFELVFTRLGDTTTVDTVDITISGTATGGIDYSPALPSQLIFEQGVEFLTIPLDVPVDADGPETIIITIEQLVECAGVVVQTEFTFIIDSPQPLDVQTTDINGTCGQTHLLDPVVTGGVGEYTFDWSTSETTQSIIVGPEVTTTYSVTVSDGCQVLPVTADFTVTLPVYPPLDITVDPPTAIDCFSTGPIGVVSATGGNNVFTYAWTVNGSPVNPGNTATIIVPAGDPTYYVVTVTEGCGSSVQDSVLVSTVPVPPLSITMDPPTAIDCLTTGPISVVSVTGGNNTYSYAWTVNGAAVNPGNTPTIQVPAGPPTYYVVTVTEGCGSTIQDSVLVTTAPLPPIEITTGGDTTVICTGDTTLIEVLGITGGNGVYTLRWTDENGATISSDYSVVVDVPGDHTYTITVEDQCNYVGSATVTTFVPNYEPFRLTLPADHVLCAGDSTELLALVTGGSGYYHLKWHLPDSLTDPLYWFAPEQTTEYVVTAKDHCGEEVTDAVEVEVEHVVMGIEVTNKGQDDWYLQAATLPYAMNWIWDMGDGTRYRDDEVYHSYVDLEEHWVTLKVVTPNGCRGMDSVLLKPPAHIYFPLAFTPDGDGLNELFGPYFHDLTEFEMTIFNRWGEELFNTKDPMVMWDGKVGGTDAQTGVYVYTYRVVGNYFPPAEGIGHVTLLRGSQQ